MYNQYISLEKLKQFDQKINDDLNVPAKLKDNPVIREVCRAGLYLIEELQKLNCPDELLARLQYTAGKLSYGKNPWEVHQEIIDKFKNNQLTFEEELELESPLFTPDAFSDFAGRAFVRQNRHN